MKPDTQKAHSDKINALKGEYFGAIDPATKEYIRLKIINLIVTIEKEGVTGLDQIKRQLQDAPNFNKIYQYNLSENLREQKAIVGDSIDASPMHIKKLELKKTVMVNYPEQLGGK